LVQASRAHHILPLPVVVLPAAAATPPARGIFPWQVARGKVVTGKRWCLLLSIRRHAVAPLLLLLLNGPLRCLLTLLLRWWWAHGTRPGLLLLLLLLLLPQASACPSPIAAAAASCWIVWTAASLLPV
jgi:hypothetical protein